VWSGRDSRVGIPDAVPRIGLGGCIRFSSVRAASKPASGSDAVFLSEFALTPLHGGITISLSGHIPNP
jgi:hypothetical protein